MKGRWIPLTLMTLCLILVLAAFPAPSRVGAAEVLMALVSLALFAHFLLIGRKSVKMSGAARLVGLTLVFHVTAWIMAAVVGMASGVDALSMARSLLPQILFAPVAFVGLYLLGPGDSGKIVKPLVFVAFCHGLYLIGLGVFAYSAASGVSDLQVSRITLIDPRTTVPLFLALVPFGLAMLTREKVKTKLFGIGCVFLGCSGALATQTRAQILAIAVAVLVFGALWVVAHPTRKTFAAMIALAGVGIVAVVALPPLRNLALSVIERQAKLGDNARFDAEWLPALETWDNYGPGAALVGIGLGTSIKIQSGEENTYLHNQIIYVLVYTGLIGTLLIYSLYFMSFVVFCCRFLRERSPDDAAAAALLASLVVYVLFFAVHKLFSFTLMVFVLTALAMRRSAADTLPQPVRDERPLPSDPVVARS